MELAFKHASDQFSYPGPAMRAQGADGGGHGEGGRGQRREGKEQGIKSLAGLRIE
jgi:hypothetical protein